jgi:hypothetical protein
MLTSTPAIHTHAVMKGQWASLQSLLPHMKWCQLPQRALPGNILAFYSKLASFPSSELAMIPSCWMRSLLPTSVFQRLACPNSGSALLRLWGKCSREPPALCLTIRWPSLFQPLKTLVGFLASWAKLSPQRWREWVKVLRTVLLCVLLYKINI